VTLNPHTGSVSPPSVTKPSNTQVGALPTPTRTGYTSNGWYTAQTGGTKVDANTPVTGNATYYARWTINTYAVAFNTNGGSLPSGVASTVTRVYNTAVGTLPTPTRAGHLFSGWYTTQAGGTKVNANTPVAGNTTYYAHWTVDMSLNGAIVTISSALNRARVLDIPGSSTKQGIRPALWDNKYTANQRFRLIADGKGYYSIQNVNSGLALDVSGSRAGNNGVVIQWAPHGGDNQKWRLISNANGSWTIASKLNENYCLDLPGGSTARDTQPILYARGSNKINQQFYFTAVSSSSLSGIHTIRSTVASNRFVDISGASLGNGAQAILWTKNGGKNQNFRFIYNPKTGYYAIVSVHSGRALDVEGASTKQGSAVIQWSSHGGYNQQWCIVPVGTDTTGATTYAIYSAVSGLTLDVNGASSKQGASLIMWPYHGNKNQKWVIAN
jgi:uncharacterized repeat protein (TIGR02543 family)